MARMIRARVTRQTRKSYSAVEVHQSNFTYYVAVVSGKSLLQNSFVSWRHDGVDEAGFNRALSEPRARDIARYLDAEKQSISTNIVLSAQAAATLTFDAGNLSWANNPGAFLVLDGQHRLFSMRYSHADYDFPVAIYNGLTRQAEVRLFIDINTKQKGVPPALLLDIKQLAGVETTIEEKLRRLFDYVGASEESPLRGLLSPSSTKPNYVSRVTFNSALKRPLEAGALADMQSDEDRGKLVVNYLRAVDRTLRKSGAVTSRLTRATILQAFFEVFNDVVDITWGRDNALRTENFDNTLSVFWAFDFDSYGGGNRPSKTKLVSDMRASLISAPEITAEVL
jgi:DGQHR domain-containing protein